MVANVTECYWVIKNRMSQIDDLTWGVFRYKDIKPDRIQKILAELGIENLN